MLRPVYYVHSRVNTAHSRETLAAVIVVLFMLVLLLLSFALQRATVMPF